MTGRWTAVVMASGMLLGCGQSAPSTTPAAEPLTQGVAIAAVAGASAEPKLPSPPAARSAPSGSAGSTLATATAETNATRAPPDPSEERLLFDFGADDAGRAERPTREVFDALLVQFPHPHAGGKACDPNYPGTPPAERAGGILLPTITQVAGAFTRAIAAEIAFVIDYCPTGAGVPRTRRLLILEAGAVTFDHEFGTDEPFDEILSAADLDGDGRAELLVTTSVYQNDRSMLDASLLALESGKPKVLGTWRAIMHCVVGIDRKTTRKIHVRMKGSTPAFRDEVETTRCHYPPTR